MTDFVTLEQAKSLKDIGYDKWTDHIYNPDSLCSVYILSYNDFEERGCLPAPRYSEFARWLYDEKKLFISIKPYEFTNIDGSKSIDYRYSVYDLSNDDFKLCVIDAGAAYETPELAIKDAVDNIIKFLKEKQ